VDPVINRVAALYNPQLWNLYAYSRNNPITYYDPDGRSETAVIEAGKTLTPLIPFIASGGPYAAVGAAIITGVIIGIKAHEAGYPAKTAREYESEMIRSGYDALFGSKTDNVILSKGDDNSGEREYKTPISGESAKKASKDAPSWAKGKKPFKNESGKDFAERLLNDHYGKGNWSEKGPRSEHNKIKKYGDRAFK
jgi:hypothetical protein